MKKSVLTPHSALFLALNILYFLPLPALLVFEYSAGGTSAAAALDPSTAANIAWIYAIAVLAFFLGSGLKLFQSDVRELPCLRLFKINNGLRMMCYGTVPVFLLSKVLLIPLGVYREYAFETENMTGGLWSFSIFCSETLLFLSIAVLFSRSRKNVKWFLILSAINGINLLHGTRIFFMVGSFALGLYFYLKGVLTPRRAIVAALFLLAMGYFVHLLRSHSQVDSGTFSVVGFASPVMYETVFSQLSLIGVVRDSHLWRWFGSPSKFFTDILYFSVPRFLVPEKDSFVYIAKFGDLSPLGAFSGYAAGLLYFGLLFPLVYFLLGAFASWMLHRARRSSFWSVMYVYFTCDCLLRVMRDGYLIPAKVLLDSLLILGIVVMFGPARPRRKTSQALNG